MKTLMWAAPWIAGLAVCTSAVAADDKGNPDNKTKKAVETHTIRGVIAGVTVEGELAVDYRTHRAVEADMTFLTVVGSPVRDRDNAERASEKDSDKDQAQGVQRHRHNVYVTWLSPRTEVRDASQAGPKDKKGVSSNLDALEVGDYVEIAYTTREASDTGSKANAAHRSKHGRHRTYFGDAMRITILSMPAHHDHDLESQADRSSGKTKKD